MGWRAAIGLCKPSPKSGLSAALRASLCNSLGYRYQLDAPALNVSDALLNFNGPCFLDPGVFIKTRNQVLSEPRPLSRRQLEGFGSKKLVGWADEGSTTYPCCPIYAASCTDASYPSRSTRCASKSSARSLPFTSPSQRAGGGPRPCSPAPCPRRGGRLRRRFAAHRGPFAYSHTSSPLGWKRMSLGMPMCSLTSAWVDLPGWTVPRVVQAARRHRGVTMQRRDDAEAEPMGAHGASPGNRACTAPDGRQIP